jgi:hypothetical protein
MLRRFGFGRFLDWTFIWQYNTQNRVLDSPS